VRGRPERLLLAALAIWALSPVLMLALRALTPAWRYPGILPEVIDPLPAAAAGAGVRLRSALGTSAGLALATAAISTAFGFTIGRTAVRARGVVRYATLALALFTVVAPPVALGVGLQVAILQLGLIGTSAGVLLTHLVPATGYLTLFAAGVFTSFDFSLNDEARTLGASRWQVLTRLTIPLLKPRLAEAAVLGALVSWSQLATTLLIGGGLVRTLPVELLSFVQSGNDQLGSLAALALTVPPLCALGLLRLGARRTGAAL
jgi:putative spermidine/putrescine transport system permease protein